MDSTSFLIESVDDSIEIPRVPSLVAPVHRIADHVGHLQEPGRLRVRKKRHIRERMDATIASSRSLQRPHDASKPRGVLGLVQNEQAALLVPLTGKSLQEEVEPVADLLETSFDRIVIWERRLVKGNCKQPGTRMRLSHDLMQTVEESVSRLRRHRAPWLNLVCGNRLAVKLDARTFWKVLVMQVVGRFC